MKKTEEKIFDLEKLCWIRKNLNDLDTSGPPTVSFLHRPKDLKNLSQVGVFSSSFNPLTLAHTVLIEMARERFELDEVVLSLSKVTVDKERPIGLLLEDRLLSLSIFARGSSALSVALVSHGLFVDQAKAFKGAYSEETKIVFIVGYDKIVQIFDPKYYEDRDETLDSLFSKSSFIVSNRGRGGIDEVRSLLDRPENRKYSQSVATLQLPGVYQGYSSTAIREIVEQGEKIGHLVPKKIGLFINETGCFVPGSNYEDGGKVDLYSIRSLLIEHLCSEGQGESGNKAFRNLMGTALSKTPKGSELRKVLREGIRTSDIFSKFISDSV